MTSYIDKITLECLTNYKQPSLSTDKIVLDKKEMKFYRKRIIGLVKDLLYNEDTIYTRMESDFINHCIDHFKMVDQADLFQKEFADLDLTPATPSLAPTEYINQDKLMMRSKKVNMDSFVTRNRVHKPIMPQRREVDLANPELRTKGLVIEKEIPTIIYAENKEKISKKKKKTTLYVETDGENIEFKSCV